MKRVLLFTAFSAVFMVMLFIANCADPLETINSRVLVPPAGVDTIIHLDTIIVIDSLNHVDTIIQIDTLIVVDTTKFTDTLVISDTTFHVDTVIVTDTTNHVDTVIIIEPGPNGQLLCSRLACNQQEIIWMFRNPEGQYRLEFTATTESGHPTQTLLLNIDGQLATWNTSKSLELILEQPLRAKATIRITSDKPHAFGHSIDICLTMTKL